MFKLSLVICIIRIILAAVILFISVLVKLLFIIIAVIIVSLIICGALIFFLDLSENGGNLHVEKGFKAFLSFLIEVVTVAEFTG